MEVNILAVVSFSQLPFFPSSFSCSIAVSQFWNTLAKAGFLLTVWQLRFSWANKEHVIVPGITAVRILFLADNSAIHSMDPCLNNIHTDHCHNCLSTPTDRSLTQHGQLTYVLWVPCHRGGIVYYQWAFLWKHGWASLVVISMYETI